MSLIRTLLAPGLVLAYLTSPGCAGAAAPIPTASTPAAPRPATPSAPAIVLGRPTDRSVVAAVRTDADTEVYLEYGTVSGTYFGQTVTVTGTATGAVLIGMSGLEANRLHYYRARYRALTEASYRSDVEHSFHTGRPSGSTFTFVVQADPHLDSNSSTAVYTQTLLNSLADRPDFMVDLGDTSMVDKCAIDGSTLCAAPSPATQATVWQRYELVRSYFELVCHSVPLFMVLGNHDGEAGWDGAATSGSLSDLAITARKALFANPEPDAFYSGNADESPGVGLRQDYYAFEWGDALLVVLDPYAYTMRKPGSDGWGWTLGAAQYQWLASTLATSRARFKFVFSHHLLGGNGTTARGGAAFAPFFEWGGRNLDGSSGFDAQRPGWAAPIHRLLVEHRVTALFHGHDHLYAMEQLDGVIYQEVPQPGQARYDNPDPGGDYGYLGTVGENLFPSSGHLRVTVGAAEVRVEYVRSVAPADETATRKNGAIVTGYVVR